jgi:hypothetical protein
MSSRSSVIFPTVHSAADQLGQAKPSLTADIEMGRKKRATGAAECSKISSKLDWLGSRSAASRTARD